MKPRLHLLSKNVINSTFISETDNKNCNNYLHCLDFSRYVKQNNFTVTVEMP